MAERIDIGKLRGIYYNNDKDGFSDGSALSSMKQFVSTDNDVLGVNSTEISFNDIETMIIEYIQSMPIAEYNDIFIKNGKTLADIEAYVNLINIIAKFSNITSLSTIILIYCDYFSLKYEKVISGLPNGLKMKLYDELKSYTRNTELLDMLFKFNNIVKPLF